MGAHRETGHDEERPPTWGGARNCRVISLGTPFAGSSQHIYQYRDNYKHSTAALRAGDLQPMVVHNDTSPNTTTNPATGRRSRLAHHSRERSYSARRDDDSDCGSQCHMQPCLILCPSPLLWHHDHGRRWQLLLRVSFSPRYRSCQCACRGRWLSTTDDRAFGPRNILQPSLRLCTIAVIGISEKEVWRSQRLQIIVSSCTTTNRLPPNTGFQPTRAPSWRSWMC